MAAVMPAIVEVWHEYGQAGAQGGNMPTKPLFQLALKWHYPIPW
jgi:hypothetical protein